jgi:2-dehydro-3-deoxygluconokinase
MDFNYRRTLWSTDNCAQVLSPVLRNHVDVLITTIEDMAKVYGIALDDASAAAIANGELGEIRDSGLQALMTDLIDRFQLAVVGVTIRYPDSHEQHRWESAAMDSDGRFFRSPRVHSIVLKDRLGGGDTWNAGFYHGLLTHDDPGEALQRGVLTGDAATRLKQTLMYDLPIVTMEEVQSLLQTDISGGGKRTVR